MRFEWDENKAEINLARHRIDFTEAVEAFFDPHAVDDFDAAHSVDEARYSLIGVFQPQVVIRGLYRTGGRPDSPHLGAQGGKETSENL